MAQVGDHLYVANTDAVLRFGYRDGMTEVASTGEKVADLPAGTINHHWTKNLIASRDGRRLFVTVGSNSNVGENGMEQEAGRAAILEFDLSTGQSRVYASGLRNPNGLGWEPRGGALWTIVNERDELGDNLVPDYLTLVREGAFRGGAFVGEHGSWNRSVRAGYKVVFVAFEEGHPSGMPEDVLTGFVNADGEAYGRPVGVAVDRAGAVLIADDVGNTVWRVTPANLSYSEIGK